MTARPRTRSNLPLGPLVGAAVAVAFLAGPVAALLWRVPWSAAAGRLGSAQLRDALGLSLATSLAATALATALGLPLAWVLARVEVPGRRFVRALVYLPLVLPPVVGGVALLAALGRNGVGGKVVFDAFGLSLPFTTAAVVVAQAFVAMPLFVLAAEAAFRSADPAIEEMARTLGAGPARVFLRVTLPLTRPALFAGAVLCWARALGEFGATITFAGNFPRRTQTVPLQVFLLLDSDPGGALVLSALLVAVSLTVLVGLRTHWLPTRP